MENSMEEQGSEMTPLDITNLVNGIVDSRVRALRAELDVELAPLKLAVAGFIEMRESMTRIETWQVAADAANERDRLNTLRMHAENRSDNKALQNILLRHLGAHDGQKEAEDDLAEAEERTSTRRATVVKTGASVLGSAGLLKWVHDHWDKLLHHR